MIYIPKYFEPKDFFNIETMSPIIVFIVDKTREYLGKHILCGFNIISSNNPADGHSVGSKHYTNEAIDFYVRLSGMQPDKYKYTNKVIAETLVDYLKRSCFWSNIGIGIYVNTKGYMSFHFDFREQHGEWMAVSKNQKGEWNYEEFNLGKIK